MRFARIYNADGTVLAAGRPSSQYPSHSRQTSYYATYPIATPSSGSQEASPPMPPSTASGDSPPFTGQSTPAVKPILTPIDTRLHREGSVSSGEQQQARHKSSVDRLRNEAMTGSGPGSDRAPSPSSVSGSQTGDSRTTSPHPSMHGFPMPSTLPRPSFSSNLGPSHRPLSMTSMGSSRYLHPPAGGAPHQGRPIQLEMPKPLGARPDASGDFFHSVPRIGGGFQVPFDERHRRMGSQPNFEPGKIVRLCNQVDKLTVQISILDLTNNTLASRPLNHPLPAHIRPKDRTNG